MNNQPFNIDALINGQAFNVKSDGTKKGTTFTGDSHYADEVKNILNSNDRLSLGPHGGTVSSGYHENGIIAAILYLQDRYTISIINMPFIARRYFSTCTYPGLPNNL